MRLWPVPIFVAAVLALVGFVIWAEREPSIAEIPTPQASSFDKATIARGATLVVMGDCAECHTAAGGEPLAGGYPLPTPFGTIYGSNITPDPQTGIGRWSEAAFARAMRQAAESFMDELAAKAKADPVAFRLKHTADPRARDVINMAADKFGWAKAQSLPPYHGRSFAYVRYESIKAYCAIAVEIEVDPVSGQIRIVRAIAAVDSGNAANPNAFRIRSRAASSRAPAGRCMKRSTSAKPRSPAAIGAAIRFCASMRSPTASKFTSSIGRARLSSAPARRLWVRLPPPSPMLCSMRRGRVSATCRSARTR